MADELRFTMSPTDSDYTQARFAWLKFNKPFIIFVICMVLLFIGACVYSSLVLPDHNTIVDLFAFTGLVGALGSYVGVLGKASADYKLSRKYISDLTYEIDEQRFVVHNKWLNLSWAWERSLGIRETKNFFFISVWRMTFTIYKRKLDVHVLKSLKRILEDVPVKDKYLLKDKCKE